LGIGKASAAAWWRSDDSMSQRLPATDTCSFAFPGARRLFVCAGALTRKAERY